MSHRMACEDSDRVAAIVALAGAVWADPSLCPASEPVAVLAVHGTADVVIAYGGGTVPGETDPYPSAPTTAATWGEKNGCAGSELGAALDLVTDLPGAETRVDRALGCVAGGAAELWTIEGGGHVPVFGPDWGERVWGFLAAHPKP
jgi:polyhydroxybutyrate depolymerase